VPIFRKRTSSPSSAPATTADPYRDRYDIAREGYEMRIGQLARALDQAALKNYISGGAVLILAISLVSLALRGGVRPVFIPYDELGRVIRYDDIARLQERPRVIVEGELGRWLINARGIYYREPAAQFDRARAARRFLSPEAEQWLTQYFSAPDRNPRILMQEISRTVELASISKDLDRPLWHLQWREIETRPGGPPAEAAWQGTVRVEFRAPATEDEAWINPAGLRITAIEWHRVRERRGEVPSGQPLPVPVERPGPAPDLGKP
jgi:type IV secretory pathway TrbF-like protein